MDKNKPILILGAGAIGKMASDAFKSNSVIIYGFLDDELEGEVEEVPILGKEDDNQYLRIIGKDCEVFVASDNNTEKQKTVEYLSKKRKTVPTNAVHANAHVSSSAFIGYGNLVNQGATIGAFAKVTDHCLIHANALIDTDAVCESYVQVGAGAIINTKVHIEEGAFIGSGAIIVSGVKIGKGAKVGAGSVVIADVAAGETVFGNPAKKM